MKKLNQLVLGLLAFVFCFSTASCNSDDNSDSSTTFMAFVTYAASNPEGSVFTCRENLDNPLVTFTSTISLKADTYTIGKRYIIAYSNQSNIRYQSGAIDLMAIMEVFNGKVETADVKAVADLTSTPIDVTLLQREGTYINIEATAPIQKDAKQFGLYVIDETKDDEIPQVYVGFQSDNTGGYNRTFYGSISIAELWNKPGCKGINVHFQNNGIKKEIYFERTTSLDPTPFE